MRLQVTHIDSLFVNLADEGINLLRIHMGLIEVYFILFVDKQKSGKVYRLEIAANLLIFATK